MKNQIVEINVEWSGLPNLITIMVPIVKSLLLGLGYSVDYGIICRRYGLEDNKTYTLQEIGSYLGVTRERVRQLEFRALSEIKKALYGQHPKINIPPEVINETLELSQLISRIGSIVTEDEINDVFFSRYQYKPSQSDLSVIKLIFTIFNFEQLQDRISRPNAIIKLAWVTTTDFDKKHFYDAQEKIDEVLLANAIHLSFFELVVKVNKGRKKPFPQPLIRLAIKTLAYIEKIDGDSYQVKFNELKSYADKAYRVLSEKNTSLKLRQIHQEINHKLALVQTGEKVPMRSLSNQLISDPRFISLNNNAWGLAEWPGLPKGITTDIMLEYLYSKKSDATAGEILEYVKNKRPEVTLQFIFAYLAQKDKFTRVSKNTFAPAEWKRKAFVLERSPRIPKKSLIREKVQETVENFLLTRKTEWVKLEVLKEHVIKTIACKPPTFYRYLSEMDQIEKEKRPDGIYCRLAATAVKAVNSKVVELDWAEIIRGGETKTVEFKRAAKWNDYEKKADPKMIQEVVIEVAGFMNAEFEGEIFIGVDDKTNLVLGLVDDFTAADRNKPNRDGYTLFLSNAISSKLGMDLGNYFEIRFQTIQNNEICCISVKPAPRIVYYDSNLYLRGNSQTNKLPAADAISYAKRR